ncbi:hypothetical protein [Halopiger xanaduensis]|uniref:Uncharacterized protein n=1 Tax=Halopiger xanaduensis (strain DSM 18323 / JCM 14033 / SH-6) TaxID=797210 RepID=F8D5V9_HALXS|nr:hypothetical protein [Halopiger xanaduensis]AEH37685.1 hypothetical protein Halxa_3071 [Halopiger xanaduensis SH-6]
MTDLSNQPQQQNQPEIVATLTVRVPLGGSGNLADGAVRVVERIEAVEAVVNADIQHVSPGLNDTTVDLRVRAAVAPGRADSDRVQPALEDGVGVRTVEKVERVEAVEPDAPPIADVG